MRMACGCALPLGGAREAGEEASPGNADEFGRMKGEEVARGPGSMLETAEDTNRKKPTPEDVAEEPNNQLLNYANLQDYCDIR